MSKHVLPGRSDFLYILIFLTSPCLESPRECPPSRCRVQLPSRGRILCLGHAFLVPIGFRPVATRCPGGRNRGVHETSEKSVIMPVRGDRAQHIVVVKPAHMPPGSGGPMLQLPPLLGRENKCWILRRYEDYRVSY